MKIRSALRAFAALLCAAALLMPMSVKALAADGADISGKNGNLSPVYAFLALFSLIMVVVYLLWEKKWDKKFAALYGCVAMANCGYYLLSISGSLSGALWANRLSYFGCAYAVLLMLLILADVCRSGFGKKTVALLTGVTSLAFLLAASGGWLEIYYSEVAIETVNGMTVLVKSYAPLHILYTLYIVAYFAMMVAVIIRANKKKRIGSTKYAMFLAAIVLGNIAVWGVEQLINIDFEFLAISYVATTMFLMLMRLVIDDYDRLRSEHSAIEARLGENESSAELPPHIEEMFKDFSRKVETLTASERMVLQYQIDGYDLEETADKLFISVNTARKHNSNLRRKLDMNSREELGLYIDLFRRAGRLNEITYMK